MLVTYEGEIPRDTDVSLDYLINTYEYVDNIQADRSDPTEMNLNKAKENIKNIVFLKLFYDSIERLAQDDNIINSFTVYNKTFRHFICNRNNQESFIYFLYNNPQIVDEILNQHLQERGPVI